MNLIKSKQRIADHGEVFTPSWMVEAMLDLVKGETERIDSRFLEPACGIGNFLIQILQRKLTAVELKFGKSDFEKRHYALLALMCTYGIELLADNIAECRANMLEILADYLTLKESDDLYQAASYVLSQNLVHGDALKMRTYNDQPITFAEWGYLGKGKFQRRDFRFDIIGQSAHSDMQFDVIIGNPPYQMTGGAGGSSDSSIFHLFAQQALKLEPRFLSMVVPSRWMAGGRGLEEFRAQMLSSGRVRSLTDFPDSNEAFPGVQIKGGVCYFIWDAAHSGPCNITRIASGIEYPQQNCILDEFDILVRDERALGILRKVLIKKEPSILDFVSGDTPFGIATNFKDWSNKNTSGLIVLHLIEKGKRTVGYMKREIIRKNTSAIDTWKVLVPKAYGAGESFPHQILGKEIVAEPPSACTQSYLVIGPFQSDRAASSFSSYYRTRFFRFLVSLRKITQDALRSTYSWVPQQTWNRTWTDELLYKKYNINKQEITFIESMIRPMDLDTRHYHRVDGGMQ